MLKEVLERVDKSIDESLGRLISFLQIRSISTDSEYAKHCITASQWVVDQLCELGADVQVKPTGSHPIVVGKTPRIGRNYLFYAHYDVQPVDPIELWDSDPFDPHCLDLDGKKSIVARGAADDKGQMLTFFEALRAWKEVTGELPVPITFLIEGDEENGSPELANFVEENAEYLRSDLALICDTTRYDEDTPAVTTMLRGLLKEQVTIKTAERDLHSGHFGGLAPNPAMILCEALAKLKDQDGRVKIPGFYNDVLGVPSNIRESWKGLNFDAEAYLKNAGVNVTPGMNLVAALERLWATPTCEINGIHSGYGGEGFKTVLPCRAMAKVSFRLAPGQDPTTIQNAFRRYFRSVLPDNASASFQNFGASEACRMSMEAPVFQATAAALSDEWDNAAVLIGSGGSIPVARHFQTILGIDSVLIGFSLKTDQIHSPNEKYDLKSYHKGIRSWVRILHALNQ